MKLLCFCCLLFGMVLVPWHCARASEPAPSDAMTCDDRAVQIAAAHGYSSHILEIIKALELLPDLKENSREHKFLEAALRAHLVGSNTLFLQMVSCEGDKTAVDLDPYRLVSLIGEMSSVESNEELRRRLSARLKRTVSDDAFSLFFALVAADRKGYRSWEDSPASAR